MLTYKIIRDSGTPCEIQAATRGEAVARFCAETGMPLEFFKRHCKVETVGLGGKQNGRNRKFLSAKRWKKH